MPQILCKYNQFTHSKSHPLGTHSLVYYTKSTFNVSTIINQRFLVINNTNSSRRPINDFLTSITFLHAYHFFLFLCFIFIVYFFCGLAGVCMNPGIFSLCISFTCLTWISAKLGSAFPPSMLYLSYYFQPKENI